MRPVDLSRVPHRRRRQCTLSFLIALVALIARIVAAAACNDAATPDALHSTVSLEVVADRFDSPRFISTWVLRVPASCEYLADPIVVPPRDKTALAPLLACMGWTDPDEQGEVIQHLLPVVPTFVVDDGTVSLTLVITATPGPGPAYDLGPWRIELADRISASPDPDATPFVAECIAPIEMENASPETTPTPIAGKHDVVACFLGEFTPVDQPIAVQLCVDGARDVRSFPMPRSDDGDGNLSWHIGETFPPVIAWITPRFVTRLQLDEATGRWQYPRLIVGLVTPAIFLPFLFWALPRRRERISTTASPLVNGVRLVAGIPLVAIVAAVLATTYIRLSRNTFSRQFDRILAADNAEAAYQTFAASLPILAIAGLVWLSVRGRHQWLSIPGAVVALGAVWLIYLLASSPDPPSPPSHPFVLRRLSVLVALAATGGALASLLLVTVRGWPRGDTRRPECDTPVERWRWASRQDRATTRMRLFQVIGMGMTVAVVLGIVAQWLWGQHVAFSSIPPWSPAKVPLQGGFAVAWLPTHLLNYPLELLRQLPMVLPFLGLTWIVALLGAHGANQPDVLFRSGERWPLRVLALLFAAYVVGTGGVFIGFGLPVAFALALLIMRFGLGRRPEDKERQLRALNQRPSIQTDSSFLLLSKCQGEFLSRSQELRAIKSAPSSAPYDPENEAEIRKRQLRCGPLIPDRKLVTRLDSDVATLRLPPNLSPSELALTTGPGETWWCNGVIAARKGRWLAAIPFLYLVYVLISTGRSRSAFSASVNFNALTLLATLLNEIAFWLVAAFVLGCLYPYLPGRNGVLKGASLTAVFLLARGTAALLVGDTGDVTWTVRVLQLVLFLTVLGFWMDLETVERNNISWRFLVDHYQLRDVRTLVLYLAPLLLTLAGILHQLSTGETRDAITTVVSNVSNILPPAP